jgi:hypothetical protein
MFRLVSSVRCLRLKLTSNKQREHLFISALSDSFDFCGNRTSPTMSTPNMLFGVSRCHTRSMTTPKIFDTITLQSNISYWISYVQLQLYTVLNNNLFVNRITTLSHSREELRLPLVSWVGLYCWFYPERCVKPWGISTYFTYFTYLIYLTSIGATHVLAPNNFSNIIIEH